jgi:O-antigen/teichoic acid export membrane protein
MILDGRQEALAHLFGASAGVNVMVSLLLVPSHGPQAVAIARLVSMVLFFTLNCVFVHRRIFAFHLGSLIWRPLLAIAAMSLIIFVVLVDWPVILRCLIGTSTYGAILLGLKAIPVDEWLWLRQWLSHWSKRYSQ